MTDKRHALGRSDDPRVWSPAPLEPERGADFIDARVAQPCEACGHWLRKYEAAYAQSERLREYSERLDRALTRRNIEVGRLRADLGDAQAGLDEYRDEADRVTRAYHIEVERLRVENLALVDAMRDARALLHKPRPRAMAAASLLGDALTSRVLEMLPEEGNDDE